MTSSERRTDSNQAGVIGSIAAASHERIESIADAKVEVAMGLYHLEQSALEQAQRRFELAPIILKSIDITTYPQLNIKKLTTKIEGDRLKEGSKIKKKRKWSRRKDVLPESEKHVISGGWKEMDLPFQVTYRRQDINGNSMVTPDKYEQIFVYGDGYDEGKYPLFQVTFEEGAMIGVYDKCLRSESDGNSPVTDKFLKNFARDEGSNLFSLTWTGLRSDPKLLVSKFEVLGEMQFASEPLAAYSYDLETGKFGLDMINIREKNTAPLETETFFSMLGESLARIPDAETHDISTYPQNS